MDQTTALSRQQASSTVPRERTGVRLFCLALAGVILLGFAAAMFRLWLPVHGGVDQNGYLVGGKQLANTGSMALRLRRVGTGEVDPLQFVSPMWVGFDLGTPAERFVPKYPIGMPLIYAAMLKLGGAHGVQLAHLANPVAMTLALLGVFLLARLLLGSWPALGVLMLLASSPVTLHLTDNPNSHAVALLLSVWGMFLVLRWWFDGGLTLAMLGAMFCGAAISIRYTEGLLVLPIALVVLMRIGEARWRSMRRWIEAAVVLLAWMIPLALLLWHNRMAMGRWTGYDPTNESTGFAWKYFLANWDTMLRQLYGTGLMLLFPMALAGLATAFVWNWKLATVLCSWIVPCVLIYTAYYWAPETQTIGYSRFFLTIFPPMGVCAMGLLLWPARHLAATDPAGAHHRIRVAATLAMTLLLSVSVMLGIATARQPLINDYKTRRNIQQRTDAVLSTVPAGSVLFCDARGLPEHLQFVSDYVLYTPDVFSRNVLDRRSDRDADDPSPMDPGRAQYLTAMMERRTQADLNTMRDDIIAGAIQAGRRVFLFTQSNPTGRQQQQGWRSFNTRRMILTPLIQGLDLESGPRMWPPGRAMGRNLPTTMPRASWQIMEITLRPPAAPATQRSPRLATSRPSGSNRGR